MAVTPAWVIVLFLGLLGMNAGQYLRLERSRRPTESLPLDLTCQSPLGRQATMRIFKNGVAQLGCTSSGQCLSSVYNNYTVDSTSITLKIQALDSGRDAGIWNCTLFGNPLKTSNNVNIENIASLLNWNEIQLNQEWNTRTSVRPDQNIILTMTTPCIKPAPIFTWEYREGSSGSVSNLIYGNSNTNSSGCPSNQKKYINTLTLPGNTADLYYKKITLRVEVEHDSFDPSENYVKYMDSRNMQFPVRVLSVSLSPSNSKLNGFEGDSLSFVCTTSSSFPKATVTWFKGGTQLLKTSSSTSNSTGALVTTRSLLTYTATRTDHGQNILCRASNIVTTAVIQSNQVELNIFYPPSKPVIIVPNEVCAGNLTSLRCSSLDQGRPQANYQWTKNGKTVNTGSTWAFTPFKDDNGANIRCSAGNNYTDKQGDSRVQSDVTTLKVYYTPVLTVTGDLTRREGQDVRLTCSSDPQDAVVTWSPDGTGQGSTLTIRNLNRSDDRDYTCQGRFDQVCSHLQNSTVVHVVVNYAPDVSNFISVTINEGEILRLSCKADGRPSQYEFQPFVQYWDDLQAGVYHGQQSGAVYNWTKTSTSYLDTGEYECNVNNDIPDRNNVLDQRKRVHVLVRGKPLVTSDSSREAAVELGSTVQLFQTFYTSGLDIISYNWTFDNTRVIGVATTSQTKVTLVKNGAKGKFVGFNVSLVLADVKEEGVYTVNVCSILGCGSSKVNLMSQGPPLTPVNLTLIFKAPSSVVLRWIPNFPGGVDLVQTFIIQHRAQGSAEWTNTTVDSDKDQAGCYVYAQVTGLQPGAEYEYRVMGRNDRLQNNEGKFTTIISGKTTASEDQPTSSALLVLGILLGFTLLAVIALGVVVIKLYRDKTSVNTKDSNIIRHPESEIPSGSEHQGYESLDDITHRAYTQLHVNQGTAVSDQPGYLTLVPDPPVAYETVALHEYENTKSKVSESPYVNTS